MFIEKSRRRNFDEPVYSVPEMLYMYNEFKKYDASGLDSFIYLVVVFVPHALGTWVYKDFIKVTILIGGKTFQVWVNYQNRISREIAKYNHDKQNYDKCCTCNFWCVVQNDGFSIGNYSLAWVGNMMMVPGIFYFVKFSLYKWRKTEPYAPTIN